MLTELDGQDITDLLKNEATPAPATLPPLVIPNAPGGTTTTPAPTAAPVSLEAATAVCQVSTIIRFPPLAKTLQSAIANSSLARNCGPIFVQGNDTTWLTRYVAGCAEDTSLLGVNPQWVAAAMQDMQNAVRTVYLSAFSCLLFPVR